jgi:hypothetical protein
MKGANSTSSPGGEITCDDLAYSAEKWPWERANEISALFHMSLTDTQPRWLSAVHTFM